MTAVTFDTYAHIKALTEKGFSESQAVSVVNLIRDAQDNDVSHLATKDKPEAKLHHTESRLETRLAETETRIIRYMFTGFIVVLSILVAVLFKLH